ncbi:MAG: hypothetical protein KF911_02840 [Pseudomonadales bacterium]|nr:hypothetical protein [Pseudomonadales bacterium]
MNRLSASMFLCLLLILPASIRAADDPAALRTAREHLMGPLIATAPEFTVHSPQAEQSGAGYRCGAGNMNAVTLYLQHTPSDPNRTLVPLAGIAPDPAFVADLNRILRTFLSTCPDSEWVTSAHYYRDAIPYGMAVTDKLDPHIIAFRFVLRGGTLSLKPAQIVSEAQRINNDPARNPRLTLAGLQAENAAISGESLRRSADYRAGHAVASGRQPGIVYRLDRYWAQYRRPALARRIFDGDFGVDSASTGYIHGGARRYADTTDFRFLFIHYADLFSERCAAQVESWATLAEQTRVNHRSELNPVTGIFEARSDPETVTRRIDARFAGLYPGYEDDLLTAQMASALEQMKAADRGEQRRTSEMSASDMASAVEQQMSDVMDRSGVFPEFFDNHACTSATVTQMGENILRAAHGRPSLQAAGVKLANAAEESDPPPG